MKLQFFLVTLFATICFIEAHKLKLKFVSVFNELATTKGKLTLTLKGEKQEEKVVFDRDFSTYNDFEQELEKEFNEDLKTVFVSWESGSKKPLILLYLMVYVDDSKELINFYMSDTIENGKTKEYKRN